MRVHLIVVLLLLFPPRVLWAGGAAEESAASDRGTYLAESGQIIPEDQIRVDSYISEIDFRYPDPVGDIGVTMLCGHRQISVYGQEELLLVGVQGKRREFEDLPPLNLVVILDASGSMSAADKAEWARVGFAALLERLRPDDKLAVVSFAGNAEILIPSTRVGQIKREDLALRVAQTLPYGTSSFLVGLRAGRNQARRGSSRGAVNRMILISDGVGETVGALDFAAECRSEGIGITTVGVGAAFDAVFMGDLARAGAGSSRFLSSPERAMELFSTDLDRMVVPVAHDLEMRLEFMPGVEIVDTWGYDHAIDGEVIRYSQPAVHARDYETILVRVHTPAVSKSRIVELAVFDLSYSDVTGSRHRMGPYTVTVELGEISLASSGVSDPMVLMASTVLRAAEGIRDIGRLYYSIPEDNDRASTLRTTMWSNRDTAVSGHAQQLARTESEELGKIVTAKRQRCLDIALHVKKEIQNAHMRLEAETFQDHLTIVENYIRKLGGELGLRQEVVKAHLADQEILVSPVGGTIQAQLASLMREISAPLDAAGSAVVLFGRFASTSGTETELGRVADEVALSTLGRSALRIVPSSRTDAVLRTQEADYRDLVDTTLLIKTGRQLVADYAIAGLIMEMSESVTIFGRLVDCRRGEVESVAQLILPKTDDVRRLLGGLSGTQ